MEQLAAWDRVISKERSYSRRRPELTPLYRIVSSCHEDLALLWEELFQSHYGALRGEVRDGFLRYLNCGILAHGCARAECQNPECRHSELIAFSCKRRSLCPSCDAKRSVIFAENLVERVLLPYPHQHCVFSVPKRIRPFFKFNRKLHQHLYSAAWDSWREQFPEANTGAVLALHTAGDLLAHHPHIHGLFLSGSIMPDGTFLNVETDPKQLEMCFADKVLNALLLEGLLSQDNLDNMRTWQHSGFNVFVGDQIEPSDKMQLLFVARYLKKCPVSNQRLSIDDTSGEPVIKYASYKDGTKQVRSFTPIEFLAELQQHIPYMWEQTSRFFGVYSAKHRGAKRLNYACRSMAPLPEPIAKPSANWARLIKKIFEIDPLLCPKCKSEMKIKALISDPREITRLTKHLNIAEQRAPPKLRYSMPLAA